MFSHMLGQTFDPFDLVRLASLTFIELLLSSDNAIVLGLLVHKLPARLQKKALFIGIVSAFFLRGAALLAVSILLQYKWLQMLGAGYLLYLSIRHFMKQPTPLTGPAPSPSFWRTVVTIELFDLAFAIDSIIAGVVFITNGGPATVNHPKLWIVYIGGMIGLIGIRYAAQLFTKLLSRFPHLETSAYLMIGLLGIKLGLSSFFSLHNMNYFFWIGLLILFASGFRRQK